MKAFEPTCRWCGSDTSGAIPATMCDTCSMTVCTACLPEGREFSCTECRARPIPVANDRLSTASRDWGPDMVVPSPVEVRTVLGTKVIRATLGVPAASYFMSSPLRQARMAIIASVPEGSARARLSAWQRFGRFLSMLRISIAQVTAEEVADYVVWRAAPPVEGYGEIKPVRASTVMGDLSHIRAHAHDTGAMDPSILYGRHISLVLKRLGGSDKHDSVRKTPVDIAAVEKAVRNAEKPSASDECIMMAVLLAFGIFFFLRCGETSFCQKDVVYNKDSGVTLTWTLQKTRSRLVPTSMSRTCASPMAVQAWLAYKERWPNNPPTAHVLHFRGVPITSTMVQGILQSYLGAPPLLPGEQRALPWSLRAGGATLCFSKGMATDRIMRLGRWTSEVSLMYCVLTPGVQASAWRAVDVSLAYHADGQLGHDDV
jgi:hypothetical protein